MRDQVFISYSHEDEKFMKELLKHLKPYSSSKAITAWSDKEIAAGSQWLDEIKTALTKTSVAVLLVSPGFLASGFIHEHEFGPLLKEAKAGGVRILWVPLRAAAYKETPIKDYQAASAPDKPLAKMSTAVRDEAWVRICEEIKKAAQTSSLDSADAPPVILQTAPSLHPIVKWTDELRIYSQDFVGRQEELAALDRAWAEGVRIFSLHAEGGAGKTRVVLEWLRRMRDAGWRGARRVYVYSFYLQGSNELHNASSDSFFREALPYFGYEGKPVSWADEQGRILASLLLDRGLLILDGLESLQYPAQHFEQGQLKDPGIRQLLFSLSNNTSGLGGLCVITSRQPVVELLARTGSTVAQKSLNELHSDDGVELLRQFQVKGSVDELRQASNECHGHAYSLMLLGSFLKNATDHHDIGRRREIVLLEEDREHQSHAKKMFDAYVRHLGEGSPEVAALRLLGFFDRAAERDLLKVLLARQAVIYEWPEESIHKRPQEKKIADSFLEATAPLADLSENQWLHVLSRLRDYRLVRLNKESPVDAHPLLREYFAAQVRTQFPEAWRTGHQRLYQSLSGSVPYWPKEIGDLQKLYRAVAHGCLAGLHEQACADIYLKRILQREDSFSDPEAIAEDLGALTYFFATPWTQLVSSLELSSYAWLLGEAAFRLRALGRRSEAVEPMRIAFNVAADNDEWEDAAILGTFLSELDLTQGDILAAVAAGEQSVKYADLSSEPYQQIVGRTVLAEALHKAGRNAESIALFDDAEARQAAFQPEYPRLYSLPGFRLCDLLLTEAERIAWHIFLFAHHISLNKRPHNEGPNIPMESRKDSSLIDLCDSVNKRAIEWLSWRTKDDAPLATALENLTLARVTFYRAHLTGAASDSALTNATAAVEGLRTASARHYAIHALLTRAWMHCLSSDEPGCRADLDEAWEIAERGPMPLFQADIQLYRARLFHDRAALEEARRLIEKHGYHRRDGELADALAAAEGW